MSVTISNGTDTVTGILTIGYSSTHPSRNIVHANGDVTIVGTTPASGNLTVLFSTLTAATALVTLLGTTDTTFTYSDSDLTAVAMTFVLGDDDITRALDADTLTMWTVEFPWQVVT